MSSKDISDLWKEFKISFRYVDAFLSKEYQGSYNFGTLERRIIAEAAIEINDFYEMYCNDIDDFEREIVITRLNQTVSSLSRELSSVSILQFYYFDENFKRNPNAAPMNLMSLLIAIRALFKIDPKKIPVDGTTWKWFKRDMRTLPQKISKMLQTQEGPIYTHLIFLVLNAIHTSLIILPSFKLHSPTAPTSEFFSGVNYAFNGLVDLLNEVSYNKEFEESFKSSPGLPIYAYYLNRLIDESRQKHVFNDDFKSLIDTNLPKNLYSIHPKSLCFHLLNNFKLENVDEALISSFSDRKNDAFDDCPHLAYMVESYIRFYQNDKRFGIFPIYCQIDVGEIFKFLFPEYRKIEEMELNREDKDKLRVMDAKQIKEKLFRIFKDHPAISAEDKSSLRYEVTKADSGGEISDFDLPVTLGKEKIVVSFPIKSGRELQGISPKRIEERYLHQFLRPFLRFPLKKVCVFALLITPPTLNLGETFKIMAHTLNVPMAIIDEEQFCKMIKFYNY